MQQSENKVLLRVTNLKQYFPLKKRGMFVKANDGITLDIYQGEVFGLVGESGCGKSTFGRTLLQLYRQTDGRSMYYGKSLLDIAPKYMLKTVKHLSKNISKIRTKEHHRDVLREEYEKLSEQERFLKHAALMHAEKEANDALLDVANIIGSLILHTNHSEVKSVFEKQYRLARRRRGLLLKKKRIEVRRDDRLFKNKSADSQESKIRAIDEKVALLDAELRKTVEEIKAMRELHRGEPDFERFDSLISDGIDLARLRYSEIRLLRSDLQIVFQDPYSSLNPRMTVGQIIGEGLKAHNIYKKNNQRMQDYILKVMDDCGLQSYFLHRFPHQFSGGQRQRISIARSLAVKPKFVVCDEAVSALDVSVQSQIINLLQDLREKQDLTYLFITHDLSVVKYISDRIGVMYLGNIVELAASEKLFATPLHPYTRALIDAIPTTDPDGKKELQILEGDIPSPVNPPSGCKFHTRCSYCTDICKHVVPDWRELEPDHFVACHHPLSGTEGERAPEQAE